MRAEQMKQMLDVMFFEPMKSYSEDVLKGVIETHVGPHDLCFAGIFKFVVFSLGLNVQVQDGQTCKIQIKFGDSDNVLNAEGKFVSGNRRKFRGQHFLSKLMVRIEDYEVSEEKLTNSEMRLLKLTVTNSVSDAVKQMNLFI